MPSTFSHDDENFLLDGRPVQLFSGEMHYFRTPPEYWRDRLVKARAMGLNAVCTYMAWNLHEPRPGEWDFSGILDVAAFVREAQQQGLLVLLRPGPYICAEWDFGGLPPWLLADPDIRLRCNEPAYLEPATRFIRRVGEELSGLTIPRGGPIAMVQVENEYGSYGNDKDYLNAVKRATLDAGFDDVPLFTSDGPELRMLRAGMIDGCLATANFGSGGGEEPCFAAVGNAERAADERRVLVRLVRPLGHEAAGQRVHGKCQRDRVDGVEQCLIQHLHVPRRHELRADRRGQYV